MRPDGTNLTRLNNVALHRLKRDKRGATIHILALVITLFCRLGHVTACACVSGMLA